jgi:hypothetical protein
VVCVGHHVLGCVVCEGHHVLGCVVCVGRHVPVCVVCVVVDDVGHHVDAVYDHVGVEGCDVVACVEGVGVSPDPSTPSSPFQGRALLSQHHRRCILR